MKKWAYYNEWDTYAAQWIRNLIKAGHIAPGEVDERSIEDVTPDDLRGFSQVHMFAGVGVWSYALRQAGWRDDQQVWTGSCPCQPFSAASQGAGFDDERHLWPAFQHLIQQRRPAIVFGEQVASKDANAWIDLVQDDLEAMGYRVGAVPFPAASVGAPHIRDRLYWVADAPSNGWQQSGLLRGRSAASHSAPGPISQSGDDGAIVRMADCSGERRQQDAGSAPGHEAAHGREGRQWLQQDSDHVAAGHGTDGSAGGKADAIGGQFSEAGRGSLGRTGKPGAREESGSPGPTNGFWRDADWIGCRDHKFRPIEPGTFPLANGAAARVGRLRAYGNAIVAEAAKNFILAYKETV